MSDGERTEMGNGPYEGPRETNLGDPVPELVPDPVPKFEANMCKYSITSKIKYKKTTIDVSK